MFQVGVPCYLRLYWGQSVSININKTKRHFSRNIHGARMFPQCFSVFHKRNIVSSVSFCFQDANYAYATRQRILTKIRACEHLQKFCEHKQASTFKLDGTIRYPYFYFNLFWMAWHWKPAINQYGCTTVNPAQQQQQSQPRLQGPLSTSRKYPSYGWSRVC